MKKKVVILGGSGAGLIAASIIDRSNDYEVLGFLNDTIPVGECVGTLKKKIEVIGRTDDAQDLLKGNVYAFVAYEGIRNPYKTYERLKSLEIPRDRLINVIDTMTAVPYDYCEIGKGVMIAPFSQLSPEVIVSDHCLLLGNSFVGHNSYLGEFVKLTTNSVVGADVHIGKGVTVGTNAVVRERVHIGDFSLIGSGSVVVKDVPPNTIVVGNPARVLRERSELDYLESLPREVKY